MGAEWVSKEKGKENWRWWNKISQWLWERRDGRQSWAKGTGLTLEENSRDRERWRHRSIYLSRRKWQPFKCPSQPCYYNTTQEVHLKRLCQMNSAIPIISWIPIQYQYWYSGISGYINILRVWYTRTQKISNFVHITRYHCTFTILKAR